MLGLTREKFPGLVTTLYVTLVLYSFVSLLREGDAMWGLALLLLTFPWCLLLVLFWFLLPAAGGLWPVGAVVLAFAALNAYLIRRVCKGIAGVG